MKCENLGICLCQHVQQRCPLAAVISQNLSSAQHWAGQQGPSQREMHCGLRLTVTSLENYCQLDKLKAAAETHTHEHTKPHALSCAGVSVTLVFQCKWNTVWDTRWRRAEGGEVLHTGFQSSSSSSSPAISCCSIFLIYVKD